MGGVARLSGSARCSGLRLGGPHRTREAEAGRRVLRCTEEVGLLLCEFPVKGYVMPLLRIEGILILPTRTARSVRGLPVILCNRSFFSWLHLKVSLYSVVRSS